MQKIITLLEKSRFWLLLVFLLSFLSFKSLLLPGYFPMHDDILVLRLQQMEECFLDKQIPCRWSPALGFGFGQPLFNYYSPLAFYSAMIFRLVGFSIIDSIKGVFILSLIVSVVFMFFLSKEFFGKWGAVVSSVLYTYAPYRAVNIYVRGALAESVVLSITPLIFLSIYKLIEKGEKIWFFATVLSLTFFFLSHNITVIILTPFVIAWAIFWVIKLKKIKKISALIVSGIFAVCFSAFFLVPAILEKQFVSTDFLTASYNDFHNHFVYFGQLFFLRYWDYGPSLGKDSRMSFQIGWPHWWILIPTLFLSMIFFLRKKANSNIFSILFFVVVFGVSAFLAHWRSVFVWENLPLLSFVQFPWRFLGLISLSTAFAGGGLIYLLGKISGRIKAEAPCAVLLVFLAIALNYSFFRPSVTHSWMTDEYKLTGIRLESQMKSAMFDFLPKTVKNPPQELAGVVLKGDKEYETVANFINKSNSWQFIANVSGQETTQVKAPVFYFPGWRVYVDGIETETIIDDKGVIGVEVPPGEHLVQGKFTNTPVRTVSNIISLVSLLILAPFCLLNPLKLK